jgi:hypothetical protein
VPAGAVPLSIAEAPFVALLDALFVAEVPIDAVPLSITEAPFVALPVALPVASAGELAQESVMQMDCSSAPLDP